MQKLNVLVFPYGTEIANEIVQSLHNNKHFNIVLASSDTSLQPPGSQAPIHWLPFVTEEGFEKACQSLLEELDISLIVPAHDDAALVFSGMQLPDRCKVVGQTRSVNEVVRFKDRTYSALQGHVAIPRVQSLESLRYPAFAKPKRGQGSKHTFLLQNPDDLAGFLTRHAPSDFVFTEYLPGDEFSIDCFSTAGDLRFAGPRTRERTLNGISVLSRSVAEGPLHQGLIEMAGTISRVMSLHGLWFFQAKLDIDGSPKLLEVGVRVSGTMMLNRVRGINFVELAIHQALGKSVTICPNAIDVIVTRALRPRFHHQLSINNLFVDFDDTLILDNRTINTDVMNLVFKVKNAGGRVILITKHGGNSLATLLNRFGISSVFDAIHHLAPGETKATYFSAGDVLVDDSFAEREKAIEAGAIALGLDALQLFLD